MKKNLQRFGASVLAAAMVAQSVALPAAAETTKIDSSVAQSVAASAASAASAVQSLPKFTSTADLIKQTAQTLAAQGEVHELEQDDAKLEATAQSKAGMSLAALENALADAMYANAAAGKINTEAYGLNKDEMASVMAATIKTYHLSSAVTDLGYETNAAGVVTAVTFTGSSGMTSAMESMTNSDDEVIAQQADSYAQAYVAENSDTFAASAAADGHTYGEPKWYWNDTNPEHGHTHTWKETPDGYWTKTDDGNVGVPMIHSVISIFKPGTQEELTYNTPGEICMTGPGVMLGYDRPEATAKALQVHADGKTWLHTGDIGYMSEDGVLYTMTRGASPRFGGGDLMVQPLENIVADADIKGIKDEFFVIVPDDEHEGCFLPYLYVQLKDGYTLDDVRDKINACLPERYMRPVEIFTVPERPFFHFKTNRIGLSKEIIAKRNQQKEKAKRNSFADGCIA